MNRASPETSAALSTMLDTIDATLRENDYAGEPIIMYLAGGLAIDYYSGGRSTSDVDATFSKRITLDHYDVIVDLHDASGKATYLYLDASYAPVSGFLHEGDAQEWEGIGNERRLIQLRVLSPLDIAVSKLERLGSRDRSDIQELVRRQYFDEGKFRERAAEAASKLVGNVQGCAQPSKSSARTFDI